MKRLIRVGVREIQMSELEEWWSDTETEKHAEGRGEGAVDENCRRGGRERWSRVDGKSAGRRRRTLQWRSERIVADQRTGEVERDGEQLQKRGARTGGR